MPARRPVTVCRSTLAAWLLCQVLVGGSGAQWCDSPVWRDPPVPTVRPLAAAGWGGLPSGFASTAGIDPLRAEYAATRDPQMAYELAERLLGQAVQADQATQASAIDLYFQATTFAWIGLWGIPDQVSRTRAAEIYHASLARLLLLAQRQGRFQPGQGLLVQTAGGPVRIPLAIQQFFWRPEDFQELHPVGDYRSQAVKRIHRRAGWGVPLVVRRTKRTFLSQEEPFLADETSFGATTLLRPDVELLLSGQPAAASPAALELYNPLVVTAVASPGGPLPLRSDLSAMFAFREVYQPPWLGPLDLFLRPDTEGPQGLYFLEPYQPGKIPVLLIHGLLSSPWTWANLANDLRAIPGFTEHFQLWMFRYATGAPFLESGARLRTASGQALATLDPGGSDPALRQMVLVGHSMGGLIAKLQVISGGDPLWRTAANRPLEQIVVEPAVRERLTTVFYFPPQASVRRVVFIATPHAGSSWAQSCLGRLGSDLVRRGAANQAQHATVIAANPGVFSPEFQARVPTSIDLLETTSPLLQAIHAQPIWPGVRFHTIAGTGGLSCGRGPGDGVVSVASARLPGAASELFVPFTHTTIHHQPESIAEVARILSEQLAEYQLGVAQQPQAR